MSRKTTIILIASIALFAAACGTVAKPVYDIDNEAAAVEETEGEAVAVEPTEEPTIEPTVEPTVEPTIEPTAEPTEETAAEEPTEEAGMDMDMGDGEEGDGHGHGAEAAPANDPVSVLVSIANAENGEELFNTVQDTAAGPFMCATCHRVDSEEMLVGPGLLNIKVHGAGHVEGLSVAQYLYQSITEPNAYIVEGYAPNVMPQNYGEILSDNQIYDIIAYLLTLEG